jgi:hypothetical protein
MKETTNLFISARQWETPLHLNYQFSQRRMQVTVASQTTEPLEIKEELFETFQSIVLPLVTEVVVNREKAWVVFEIAAESEDVS